MKTEEPECEESFEDNWDIKYEPEDYRSSKKEEILQNQENETARYKQLLILMQKSDLFVKMIFQRMEESKQKAESKIRKLANKSRRDQSTRPTSKSKRQRISRDPSPSEERYNDSEVGDTEIPSPSEERYKDSEVGDTENIALFTGGILRDYQIEGQRWLNNLYENGISGILADEMGLGKTVQVIAAIARMIEKGVCGPFMIVAPLSTLPNWSNEFARFTPKIPVILYHAEKYDRAELRAFVSKPTEVNRQLFCYPVVITSYEIIYNDAKLLRWVNWKMLVVDEGHRLKNHKCQLLKSLKTIDCGHRILLTGTPLQNNLAELWSLLHFILPEIFNDLRTFEEWFDYNSLSNEDGQKKIIEQEKEKRILGLMHQILTPFVLRRLKSDVDLSIPPKRECILYCPLAQYQKLLYDKAVDRTIRRLVSGESEKDEEDEESLLDLDRSQRHARTKIDYSIIDASDPEDDDLFIDTVVGLPQKEKELTCISPKEKVNPKSETHIQLVNLMMILRRISNHSHMVEYPLDKNGDYSLDDRLINYSGKIQVLDRLLKLLRIDGHKVLLFSQFTSMLDILQDYCNYVGYKYSRLDGGMKLEDRKMQMQWFAEEEDIFIFLLSTRAGGLGLNLTAADTVIFFDNDWNPQQDIQAQDRCHRIGQTKPVLVFRLLIPNTVEEKIYQRASSKRTLEKLIIHGRCFKKSLKSREQWVDKKFDISDDELIKLLSSRDYEAASRLNVIDDETLKEHLDRSDLWQQWMYCDKDGENQK